MTTEACHRMDWWREARFGMFIHWSVGASLNGYWKGIPTNFVTEWVRHTGRIPRADFHEIARNFNPRRYDAAEWVTVARQAGMKYMVFTAKHHDGFCFWDTAQTEFKITNTACKRDTMRELADECRRQQMPLGWYYSPRDWDHPDYLPHYSRLPKQGTRYKSWWGYLANPHTGMGGDGECGCASCRADRPVVEDRDPAKADLSRYLLFMRRQLEELVTKYGPTALLWFDGQEHPPAVGGTAELIKFLRGLKSDLLINDRVSTEPGWGDFAIHEWNIPKERQSRDWESCLCVNGSWAFNAYDLGWKPARQLIHELIEIVSRGGNLLLNVGPDQDGVIPAVAVARLQEMGNWMRVNGEAIHGTIAGIHDATGAWRFTRKGTVDYALTLEWPGTNVVIPGMRLQPHGSASLLGVETTLRWENVEAGCQIKLPDSVHVAHPCDHAWAFRLTGAGATY